MKPIDHEQPVVKIDEEKPTELCTNVYAGTRCTRPRDHEGKHACLYLRGAQTLRWD